MNHEEKLQVSASMTHIIIRGMQEYLGQSGTDQLFECCGLTRFTGSGQLVENRSGLRYTEIQAMQQALEDIYGAQGARGAAMRSGRSALCYFLKVYGESAGFNELDFRLLPPRRRVQVGLERLAQVIGGEIGQTIHVQTVENAWTLQIEHCPECWGMHSSNSVCYFTVGILQEFLSWLSGGRVYLVEETACRAKGDPACIIRVGKKTLD